MKSKTLREILELKSPQALDRGSLGELSGALISIDRRLFVFFSFEFDALQPHSGKEINENLTIGMGPFFFSECDVNEVLDFVDGAVFDQSYSLDEPDDFDHTKYEVGARMLYTVEYQASHVFTDLELLDLFAHSLAQTHSSSHLEAEAIAYCTWSIRHLRDFLVCQHEFDDVDSCSKCDNSIEDFDFWLEFSKGVLGGDQEKETVSEAKNSDLGERCLGCGVIFAKTMKFCTECGNRFTKDESADSEPADLNELSKLLEAEIDKVLPLTATLTYSINFEGNELTMFIVNNDHKLPFTDILIPTATIEKLTDDVHLSSTRLMDMGWKKSAGGFWQLRHGSDVEMQNKALGHLLSRSFLVATNLDPVSWVKSLKSVNIKYSSQNSKLGANKPTKEGAGCWLGLLQLVLLGWFLGHHIFHLF